MKKIIILISSLLAFSSSALFAEGNAEYQKRLERAKAGDAKSQTYVALRLDKGRDGVTENIDEAIKWYVAAAWQGETGAQAIAAQRLYSKKQYVDAYQWLSLAAAKGHKNSQKDLSKFEKKLKPAELEQAKKWIKEFKPKVAIPE